MELNQIYNEDCLEGIARIPTGSIQTVICDPPYFCGMTHNGRKGTFGDLNVSKPFFSALFREIARVLTGTGCIYWFCDWRTLGFYYPLLTLDVSVMNTLVWDKGSGPGNFYTSEHEMVLFATRNTQFRCKGARNVLRGIPGFGSGAKRTNGAMVHPTQKPVELIARLITDRTAEGDPVLEGFMGSGTTAGAALRPGRRFVGCATAGNYPPLALRRIENERQQLKLAL